MKATLYKTLSNEQEIITVAAGQTVEKAFPKTNFENAVIIVNGKKQNKDYLLKESDIVTIRELPAGVTAAIITIAVVAVAAGVVAGISIYKAKKAAEEAQRELDKVKKLTNKQDIDNRPFLRGASNTLAKNNSQPYICGRHLFTPYLLCNPFYKLAGNDGVNQYTYTVLECGFNKQVLQQIAIDDIKIKTFQNATQPQEGYFQLDSGQVFAEDGLIEISQDGGLLEALPELNYRVVSTACNSEIPRDSKVAEGNASHLTYSLDANAKSVDIAISFPYGLYAYNDENDKIETQVTITPQYSLDNGANWIDFTFNNNGADTNTFRRNVSSKEMRFNAHKDFTLADYATLKNGGHKNIIIRLRNNGNDDSKIKNDCYCLYYQSQCFDPNKSSYPAGIINDGGAAGLVPCKIVEDRERAYCTILGMRVKATHNNEDKLNKINIITQGLARIYNGVWSAEKQPTRNPAAWVLEILTSDSHPKSKFEDSEIDLQSFGDFYNYCEENEFRFDHVLTQNAKKGDTINTIMENCGAVLYWDMYGRLAVAIDRPQENAVAVYNAQNIIGEPQNKKTFGRRTDGLRIKYITSYEDLYSEETYLLMREENGETLPLNENSTIKDVTATGITEHKHIVKYARRLMAIEALRPKTTTIEIGKEGVYYSPYSKVLLQDDSLKIGTGNGAITNTVWQNGFLTKIQINEYVTFESGKRYGVIVNCYGNNKAVPIALKVTGSGYTDTMTLTTQVADSAAVKPEIGCVLSFGELDENGDFVKITTPYMIMNTRRTDKGFSLELVNYNEAIYDSGTIPDYVSNITQKPQGSGDEIPPDYVTSEELHQVIDDMQSGNIPVGKPDAPYNVRAYAKESGITFVCDVWGDGLRNELKRITWKITKADGETTATIKTRGNTGEYEFDRAADGYPEAEELAQWKISATAENAYGKTSDESEERPVNVELYGTWQLAAPSVTVRESARVISLSFVQTARADGRKRYGNIKHRIKIKRLTPPADEEFYKPAQSANPWQAEENYKDGAGFLEAGNTYAQTLPLVGQSQNLPTDTTYSFNVVAFNEAGASERTIINAVARGTNIKDIVENAIGTSQVREGAITADKIYVEMISAIQSNLGYITGGVFEGNENNRWALSNITLPDGSTRYEGAMRVGGDDEYFEVEPYDVVNGVPQKYHVRFKAGNFEITSQASNINGMLYIMNDADALDRTKISPQGTYYQHRETIHDEWRNIAANNVNGVQTPQVFSDNTLFITNQDMRQRRKEGYDIGNAYLSSRSRVYHFDTDIFDQNGNNDLTVTDAEIDGGHNLVGAETESADIDFTPAILAVAPYATIGKSLYGRYGIRAAAESCAVFTVDFWIQYIYAENQIIFDVGNAADKIKLLIASAECYFEKGTADESGIPFNAEILRSRLYDRLPTNPRPFNDQSDPVPFNAPTDNEPPFNTPAAKEYRADNIYYTMQEIDGVETFTQAEVTAANYYAMIAGGLYEKTIAFNQPDGAHNYLQHDGQTQSETVELSELRVQFEQNQWLHIGIIADTEKIYVALNDKHTEFDRYGTAAAPLQIELNSGLNSFMLDELMIDNTTAEELAEFYEHTKNRIPWAKLTKSDEYFILTVRDLENFKTNIFDTPIFREKVTAVLQDFINNLQER